MKITYSHSGAVELDRFLQKRKEELEQLLRREKYVLGDEELEITASDILKAEHKFKTLDRPRTASQLNRLKFLVRIYLLAGIAMLIAGFFYQDIRTILSGDPIQKMLVVAGFSFSLFSVFASYYIKERTNRRREMEKLYFRHHMRTREEKDQSDG